MRPQDIGELERELGHCFRNRSLLEQALTHSSFARESESLNGEAVADNELLEFLGDSVLAFVTSQVLFEHYPEFQEGRLSKLRAHLVSEQHLIRSAKKLKLGRFLRLSRGEEKSGGRNKTAIQVDALEAVLASIYMDAGMEFARQFILQTILEPELKRLKKTMAQGLPITDFKSALQEILHSTSHPGPAYVLVQEDGPEHCKKFTVEVRVIHNGKGPAEYVAQGQGTTKKNAEQEAAKRAFEHFRSLSVEPRCELSRTRKSSLKKI